MIIIPVELRKGDDKIIADPRNPLHVHLDAINSLQKTGLRVSEEELFTYALYTYWDKDVPGWRSYKAIARHLPDFRARYETFVRTKFGELVFKRKPTRDITEQLGVGAGLSAIRKLCGLTEADFRRIIETSAYKTTDYSYIASDGKKILEIEAKGTHDSASKSAGLASIDKKKTEIRIDKSRKSNAVLVGTVLDIKYEKNNTKLILADPPINSYNVDPYYLKLVNRLAYYHSELVKISRGQVASALINRITILENIGASWKDLDDIPLVNVNGENIRIYEQMADPMWLEDGTMAHGRIYDLRLTSDVLNKFSKRESLIEYVRSLPQRLYFRGIDHSILETMVKQNYQSITTAKVIDGQVGLSGARGHFNFNFKRRGQLQRQSSGVIAGLFTQDNWDDDILPTLLERIL